MKLVITLMLAAMLAGCYGGQAVKWQQEQDHANQQLEKHGFPAYGAGG